MATQINWDKLLSTKRTRELLGGKSCLPENDPRDEFERDYDRSIFSTPIRRLQDKTQVFPLETHDSIRTRLTHSHEVAAVSKGIAGSLRDFLSKNGVVLDKHYQIKTIASTIGLLHDLGNPPFGHAGEEAMREWFKKKLEENDEYLKKDFNNHPNKEQMINDFLLFDGNAQTIRLLSKLQMLADFYGLNLTCGTLSALCKYTAKSNEASKKSKNKEITKLGYFTSENKLIQKLREEVGTNTARNPITYMMEAADDIVYSLVDMEDGVKKGVLKWEDITGFIDEFFKDKDETKKKSVKNLIQRSKDEIDKRLKDSGADLSDNAKCEGYMQMFRTYTISDHVNAVSEAFQNNYEGIMSGNYHGELIADSRNDLLMECCKQIAKKRVIPSAPIIELEIKGRRIISDLMDLFWDGSKNAFEETHCGYEFKVYSLMSQNYKTVFSHMIKENEKLESSQQLPINYLRLQLVADYVCGMTDTFAQDLHRRISNA